MIDFIEYSCPRNSCNSFLHQIVAKRVTPRNTNLSPKGDISWGVAETESRRVFDSVSQFRSSAMIPVLSANECEGMPRPGLTTAWSVFPSSSSACDDSADSRRLSGVLSTLDRHAASYGRWFASVRRVGSFIHRLLGDYLVPMVGEKFRVVYGVSLRANPAPVILGGDSHG